MPSICPNSGLGSHLAQDMRKLYGSHIPGQHMHWCWQALKKDSGNSHIFHLATVGLPSQVSHWAELLRNWDLRNTGEGGVSTKTKANCTQEACSCFLFLNPLECLSFERQIVASNSILGREFFTGDFQTFQQILVFSLKDLQGNLCTLFVGM